MRPLTLPAFFLAASAVVLYAGCGPRGSGTVAEVNGESISAADFRERYEKYLSSTGARDNIVVRKQVLDNMISERLIFREIERSGMDQQPAYRRRMEEIRLQALLDTYSRRISVDTVTVSDQELQYEFGALVTKAEVRYLYSPTEEGARALKRRIEKGERFEDAAKQVFADPGLANNGGYLGVIGYGEMEPALERAAFTQPIGVVSDPFPLSFGYGIVRVEHRVRQPLASEQDYAKNKLKLERAIIERKVGDIITREAHAVARTLDPVFDDAVFVELFQVWPGIREQRTEGADLETPDPVRPSLREKTLMGFRGGSWTVDDFLARMDWTTARQRKHIRSVDDLKNAAVGLATREALLDKARAKGLEEDPLVRAQIGVVATEFKLRYWSSSVQDTVGAAGIPEAMLRSAYDTLKAELLVPPQVNVAEVLLTTRDEADRIMQKLRGGADFGTLARAHSIRSWAAKQGGELGFGTKATFGILGEKFFAAEIGDLIGPEFVEPYFGVFKILARKEGRGMAFEEAKEGLSERIVAAQKREAVRRAVGQLRSPARIAVHMDVLENITLSQGNTTKDQSP